MTNEEAIRILEMNFSCYKTNECTKCFVFHHPTFRCSDAVFKAKELAIQALKNDCENCTKEIEEYMAECRVEKALKQPEIVYCGDCIYWHSEEKHCGLEYDGVYQERQEKDFCSFGEVK